MDFIKVVKWFLMLLKVPPTEDTSLEMFQRLSIALTQVKAVPQQKPNWILAQWTLPQGHNADRQKPDRTIARLDISPRNSSPTDRTQQEGDPIGQQLGGTIAL